MSDDQLIRLEEPVANTPENSAYVLDSGTVMNVVKCLKGCFDQSRRRIITRLQEAKVREGYDDRDLERDTEDRQAEEELQSNVADCLVVLVRTHGEMVVPTYAKILYPALKELVGMTEADRRFSLKVLNGVVEWGGAGVMVVLMEITDWLVKATKAKDQGTVEIACYGLGAAARAQPDHFRPLAMVSDSLISSHILGEGEELAGWSSEFQQSVSSIV